MKEEILACIDDENIKYLQSGQISKYIFPMERNEAHKKQISHLIIRFFILTINFEGKGLYLVQKRSKNKTSYPEYYTDSASGHVIFERNMNLQKIKENAIRELEEEFGIERKEVKKVIFHELRVEKNEFTKEIAYIFFGLVDSNVKLKPNPYELVPNESRFYSKSELEKLLEKQNCVDYSKDIWGLLLKKQVSRLFETKIDNSNHKSNEIALFIGRFQPLHHGHIYVMNRILELHKILKIAIGSSQLSYSINDPFTSNERIKFIEAALKKRNIPKNRYEIYEVPDIFDAKKWVDHIISIVGDFDIVYSNSDWVRQLFLNKDIKIGKKHVIFKNKYNATNIRNMLINEKMNWSNLVPNEVIILMKQFNGIDRIKDLHTNIEKT